MSTELLEASLQTALLGGTPVLLAATGEVLVEKAGIYNVGIEGTMLMGALVGFIVGHDSGSFALGMGAGMGAGILLSIVLGTVIVLLGGELVVAGLAIWFGALGLSSALGTDYVQQAAGVAVPGIDVPVLSGVPLVGPALFDQPVVVYMAIAIAGLMSLVLYRSSYGLSIRTVGESPETADALGVPVSRVRMLCLAIGGACAGLGGAFLSLGIVGTWLNNVTNGQGWIAFALVVFAAWKPLPVIAGAYLFGLLGTLGDVGQALGWNVPSPFFSALPYLGTVAVVIAVTLVRRRSGKQAPWPAALGRPFIRSG